jgi:hypothetical protein
MLSSSKFEIADGGARPHRMSLFEPKFCPEAGACWLQQDEERKALGREPRQHANCTELIWCARTLVVRPSLDFMARSARHARHGFGNARGAIVAIGLACLDTGRVPGAVVWGHPEPSFQTAY